MVLVTRPSVAALPENASKSGCLTGVVPLGIAITSRKTTGTSMTVGVTPEAAQVQPASTRHVAEQPSPAVVLPSSQAFGLATISLESKKPSPQTEVHAVVAPPA